MEYRFTHNDIGQAVAHLNMEAEAFAHWLNIEMGKSNLAALKKILKASEQIIGRTLWDFDYTGSEFNLELSRQNARICANSALAGESAEQGDFSETDNMDDEPAWDDDDVNETDMGLVAHCGIEDFRDLLSAWIGFLEEK